MRWNHLVASFLIIAAGNAWAASSTERQVAYLVNLERADAGLPPLKMVPSLNEAARGHSNAMSSGNFFAHCDLVTGKSPWTRMSEAGYQWSAAAENVAAGQSTAAAVMDSWMNSPGHRRNILGTGFREIGVGLVYDPSDSAPISTDGNGDCVADGTINSPMRRYWTQNFGARNGVYPVVVDFEAIGTSSCSVQVYAHGAGWAQDFRIRQAGQSWTAWQPYREWTDLVLTGSNGSQVTVEVELRRNGSITRSTDNIRLDTACTGGGGSETPLYRNGFE